ncbi:MAG: hypothetical protein M1833_001362 [Piccolia ochrophora]|nr:MAG: hypothetical protein M1833_001362 [Piccolia ochrophora]
MADVPSPEFEIVCHESIHVGEHDVCAKINTVNRTERNQDAATALTASAGDGSLSLVDELCGANFKSPYESPSDVDSLPVSDSHSDWSEEAIYESHRAGPRTIRDAFEGFVQRHPEAAGEWEEYVKIASYVLAFLRPDEHFSGIPSFTWEMDSDSATVKDLELDIDSDGTEEQGADEMDVDCTNPSVSKAL